jgi:hypothetical protein
MRVCSATFNRKHRMTGVGLSNPNWPPLLASIRLNQLAPGNATAFMAGQQRHIVVATQGQPGAGQLRSITRCLISTHSIKKNGRGVPASTGRSPWTPCSFRGAAGRRKDGAITNRTSGTGSNLHILHSCGKNGAASPFGLASLRVQRGLCGRPYLVSAWIYDVRIVNYD